MIGLKAWNPRIIEIFDGVFSQKAWSPPGVSLIAARSMWPTTRGKDTVVAVVDTGIDYTHPDLKANVIGGQSFVPGEPDYMDENGHGTHVAGTIAANGQILGVAPEAKILAVKVLNKDGMGGYLNINLGLAWARKWKGKNGEKVNVINMSLGGAIGDNALHQELIKVVEAGITVVCAAGNSGDGNPDTDEISYPAYYPETLAVGAIDLQTGIANFSNSNDRIDIVAPGVETYSTYPGNRYVKLSGTSMAAPQISGAVALIYSRYKIRFNHYPSPETVRSMVHYQAIDLGQAGFDTLYGFGMFSFNLDGGKAIKLFLDQQQYYVNKDKRFIKTAPFAHEGEACCAIPELAEILGVNTDKSSVNGVLELDLWK
ncbi:MAG: S8 family peptidase [Syntrophomonadaceae bacterium]|nr:S8 family peptidase [Syntrophomonadaceae bacterium]